MEVRRAHGECRVGVVGGCEVVVGRTCGGGKWELGGSLLMKWMCRVRRFEVLSSGFAVWVIGLLLVSLATIVWVVSRL